MVTSPKVSPLTIRDLLREGQFRLSRADVDTPRLDAEVLLMDVLGTDRAGLYLAYPNITAEEVAGRFRERIERRVAGEPVAYLTGHREFMGLDFQVDRRVLIPRPETEFLVEWALERLRTPSTSRKLVVDIGTGSGAVAVSLAHLLPDSVNPLIIGSDRDRDALQVAAMNRDRLAPGRVELVLGDLLEWCEAGIDVLLANLPYLRLDQAHDGLAWEPVIALYAGADGLDLYRRLLPRAKDLLNPGGALVCEIDPDQAAPIRELARRHYPTAQCRVDPDLAGLDRYLIVDLAG
ncbi:peptide chain release factor N(5)-glutamine methyltransferase [Nitrolancea hollandica]|uniref:Release factor glutamine methyltransferase n=1 Tax=Nitrolancea hollandica Lb TaxID=1129897 RepID=I4EGT0_9BACT|nr:peptide chain release factor N(5)-glutamine methyltransferase [Nitrolancea hollandica]CCF83892.1 Modification methylase, HemK family [Nitrolancea hollandica Lb]